MGSPRQNTGYGDDGVRDPEKQHMLDHTIRERLRPASPKGIRLILRHIFHWGIALLAMAIAAWCLLGAILLCYGNYTSPWPRRPCTADGMARFVRQDAWCHTQNDRRPLAMALTSGCPSIGVEVWLSESQELVVGDGPNQTFASMYVEPWLELLVPAETDEPAIPNTNLLETLSTQEFVLVLSLVGDSTAVWPRIHSAIEPLRQAGLLTHFDGLDIVERPLTIVTDSGFREIIVQGDHRDIFFDAPLELFSMTAAEIADDLPYEKSPFGGRISISSQTPLGSSEEAIERRYPKNPAIYSAANSYYASASFRKTVGQLEAGRLSEEQLDVIDEQVEGAHARGLKVRYTDLPPPSEAGWEYLQQLMWEQGVDVVSISHV